MNTPNKAPVLLEFEKIEPVISKEIELLRLKGLPVLCKKESEQELIIAVHSQCIRFAVSVYDDAEIEQYNAELLGRDYNLNRMQGMPEPDPTFEERLKLVKSSNDEYLWRLDDEFFTTNNIVMHVINSVIRLIDNPSYPIQSIGDRAWSNGSAEKRIGFVQ